MAPVFPDCRLSLFDVFGSCLPLPSMKNTHACSLQDAEGDRLRVLVIVSLVVPGLPLPLSHYLATSLDQPRNDWDEALGVGGGGTCLGVFPSKMFGAPGRSRFVFIVMCCYRWRPFPYGSSLPFWSLSTCCSPWLAGKEGSRIILARGRVAARRSSAAFPRFQPGERRGPPPVQPGCKVPPEDPAPAHRRHPRSHPLFQPLHGAAALERNGCLAAVGPSPDPFFLQIFACSRAIGSVGPGSCDLQERCGGAPHTREQDSGLRHRNGRASGASTFNLSPPAQPRHRLRGQRLYTSGNLHLSEEMSFSPSRLRGGDSQEHPRAPSLRSGRTRALRSLCTLVRSGEGGNSSAPTSTRPGTPAFSATAVRQAPCAYEIWGRFQVCRDVGLRSKCSAKYVLVPGPRECFCASGPRWLSTGALAGSSPPDRTSVQGTALEGSPARTTASPHGLIGRDLFGDSRPAPGRGVTPAGKEDVKGGGVTGASCGEAGKTNGAASFLPIPRSLLGQQCLRNGTAFHSPKLEPEVQNRVNLPFGAPGRVTGEAISPRSGEETLPSPEPSAAAAEPRKPHQSGARGPRESRPCREDAGDGFLGNSDPWRSRETTRRGRNGMTRDEESAPGWGSKEGRQGKVAPGDLRSAGASHWCLQLEKGLSFCKTCASLHRLPGRLAPASLSSLVSNPSSHTGQAVEGPCLWATKALIPSLVMICFLVCHPLETGASPFGSEDQRIGFTASSQPSCHVERAVGHQKCPGATSQGLLRPMLYLEPNMTVHPLFWTAWIQGSCSSQPRLAPNGATCHATEGLAFSQEFGSAIISCLSQGALLDLPSSTSSHKAGLLRFGGFEAIKMKRAGEWRWQHLAGGLEAGTVEVQKVSSLQLPPMPRIWGQKGEGPEHRPHPGWRWQVPRSQKPLWESHWGEGHLTWWVAVSVGLPPSGRAVGSLEAWTPDFLSTLPSFFSSEAFLVKSIKPQPPHNSGRPSDAQGGPCVSLKQGPGLLFLILLHPLNPKSSRRIRGMPIPGQAAQCRIQWTEKTQALSWEAPSQVGQNILAHCHSVMISHKGHPRQSRQSTFSLFQRSLRPSSGFRPKLVSDQDPRFPDPGIARFLLFPSYRVDQFSAPKIVHPTPIPSPSVVG
ncbi:hypothetical protein Cadr_000013874 [Camelus dromedarius]|uniref:Uncharacterized protein n=1 Tax=Camelus dromedarius TaxID=9838 RepID=A0A5N4DB97_CAMDR|nr:hypothetical protein Cadr_000013874 [Camelus dromedarius]